MSHDPRWPVWFVPLGGAALCTVAVIALTVLVEDTGVPAVDRTIADHTHAWVVAHPPWPSIARVTGTLTQPTTWRALAVVAALVLVIRRRVWAAAWLVLTLALTAVLSTGLKEVVARPRPVWSDPVATIGGWSFPSGHAINVAAAAGCSIVLLRMVHARTDKAQRGRALGQVLAVVIAVITGLDRIALGVHFATDVVAGWVAGAGVVLLTLAVWQALSGAPQDQVSSRIT